MTIFIIGSIFDSFISSTKAYVIIALRACACVCLPARLHRTTNPNVIKLIVYSVQ